MTKANLNRIFPVSMTIYATSAEHLKAVRAELRERGMVIRHDDGEYRVNYKGGRESTAYYTDCILDAANTARIMAKSQGH